MTIWCRELIVDGRTLAGVRLTVDARGRISSRDDGVAARPEDTVLGAALPGMGNAHSHAFHRVLRGRTHAGGGDFWQWRDAMYRVAGQLDPRNYESLATATFAEMLVSGWTAVGEFHYVHHRQDGSPYAPAHAMEEAVARAAAAVGIRLTLLDTIYLDGGIGECVGPDQRRFSDGSATQWLERWRDLRAHLASDSATRGTILGAAIHSVRAVTPTAMGEVVAGLPSDLPLHVHVSEQPQENADSLAAYGLTPVGVLAAAGALSPRTSLIHATHLTDDDIALIAASGSIVVMCPTTEADLGDGIGPARALADAGVRIALGSDQNAVIDPFLEMRGLEAGERLSSGRRGRFSPGELMTAANAAGYASLGMHSHALAVGDRCDLVEVATDSRRTTGALATQLSMVATANDVRRVIVGGRVVATDGALTDGRRPEQMLDAALQKLEHDGGAQ